MSAQDQLTFSRDRITWLHYAVLGCFGFGLYLLGAVTPFLRRELDLGATVAGLHASAFAAGLIAAGVAGDRLVAAAGRGAALAVGAAGFSAALVVLAAADRPAMSLSGAAAMGGFGGLLGAIVAAALSDRHRQHRAIALTEANLIAIGCAVAAPLLVGFLEAGGSTGWRGAVVLPIAGLIAVIAASRRARSPRSASERGPRATAVGLPRAYWPCWVLLVMVVSVEFSLVFWGAEFLEAVGGLSRAGAATAMSVFVGAMFAGRAIGSRLARGRDTSALLRWMLAVSAAGFLLYWIAPALELRLAGLFVTGIGVANLYPLGLALALAVAGDASDAASARAFIASGIAILVGPLALAAIGEAVGVGPGHGVVLGFLLGAAVASAAGGARRRAVGPGLLRPRAVLSDLDGVLIDSDRSSARAWRRWAVARGLDPAAVEAALVGPPSLEVIRRVAPALDAEAEADIVEGWQAADTAGIVAMPGAAALLARLAPDRIAIVTSCTRRLALARLERAGLPAPAVLVTADMVAAGKPAPDGYLRAAELLGVEPGGCLIIEDTPGGIEAGRAAGMSVVAIASTHSRDQLGRAHRRVDRLLDLERVATVLGEG